ncbi:MAG: hypothetical protein WKF78_07370 [Candidatus Limnocylindrales bacterium]
MAPGVNFMAGVTTAETRAWWLARADQVADGMIVPIVALEAGGERVVGSVLLIYSATPNSPHRGGDRQGARAFVGAAARARP